MMTSDNPAESRSRR